MTAFTKIYDAIVYGEGSFVDNVVWLLREQNISYLHAQYNDTARFIGPDSISINGKLSQFGRALVVPRLVRNPPPIQGLDDINPEKPNISKHKTITVIGDHKDTLVVASSLALQGFNVTCIDLNNESLRDFDISVSEVLERHLKKNVVRHVTNSPILSIGKTNNQCVVICDKNGMPLRITADLVVCSFKESWHDEVGLINLESKRSDPPTHNFRLSSKISDNAVLMNPHGAYSLHDIELASKFLSGKRSFKITTLHAAELITQSFSLFTFGIREQDVVETHVAYKKSVVRLPAQSDRHPTFYIKMLCSLSGKIVGICGIVPSELYSKDLFMACVNNNVTLRQFASMVGSDSPLGKTYLELIHNLK
jgi:hypothetical protein